MLIWDVAYSVVVVVNNALIGWLGKESKCPEELKCMYIQGSSITRCTSIKTNTVIYQAGNCCGNCQVVP